MNRPRPPLAPPPSLRARLRRARHEGENPILLKGLSIATPKSSNALSPALLDQQAHPVRKGKGEIKAIGGMQAHQLPHKVLWPAPPLSPPLLPLTPSTLLATALLLKAQEVPEISNTSAPVTVLLTTGSPLAEPTAQSSPTIPSL